MRWGAAHGRLAAMTKQPPPILLQLELDLASSPIQGVLSDPAGERHPFAGWVALASVLGRVVTAADQDSPEVSQP